jgi:LPS-assembly protein
VGQAYYFEDPRVRLPDEPQLERSKSDFIAELELSAFKNWSARMGYQWDPEKSRTAKSEMYLQYAPATDRVINAGYRFRQDFIEQFDVSAAWPISWNGAASRAGCTSLREDRPSTSSSASNTARAAGPCVSSRGTSSATGPATLIRRSASS